MDIKEKKTNDTITKFRNSEGYKKKIARANESLSKARFPKGIFEQLGIPRPNFGQEIETPLTD